MLIGYPVIVVGSDEKRIGRVVTEFDGEFYEVEFPGGVKEKMLPESIRPMIQSHFIMHQMQVSSAFVTYMHKYHGILNDVTVRHSCTLRVRAIKSLDTYARLSGNVLVLFDSVSTSLEYGFLDEQIKDISTVDEGNCLCMHLTPEKVMYKGDLKSQFLKVIDQSSESVVYFKNEREWYRRDTHIIDTIASRSVLLEAFKKNMWATGESSKSTITMNYEPRRGFMYIFTESEAVFNIVPLEWPLAFLDFGTNNDAMELRMMMIDDSYCRTSSELDNSIPKLEILPDVPFRYGQKNVVMSNVTKGFKEIRSGKYVDDVQLQNVNWIPIFWLHVQFLVCSNIISELQDRKFKSKSMAACESICLQIFSMFQSVPADLWWKPKDALRIARQNIYSGYMNEHVDYMIRIFEADSVAFRIWAGNLNSMLLIYGRCRKPRPVQLELNEEKNMLKVDDHVFFSSFMHPFHMKSIVQGNILDNFKPPESRFEFDDFFSMSQSDQNVTSKKKRKKKKNQKPQSSPQSVMNPSFDHDLVENLVEDTTSSVDNASVDNASVEAISSDTCVLEDMRFDELSDSSDGTFTSCEPYFDNVDSLEEERKDEEKGKDEEKDKDEEKGKDVVKKKDPCSHDQNYASSSEIGTMTSSPVLTSASVQTFSPLTKTVSVMTDDDMYENMSENMRVLNQRHNKDTQVIRQLKAKQSKHLEELRVLRAQMASDEQKYQETMKALEVHRLAEDKACIEKLELRKSEDAATIEELRNKVDEGLKEVEALKTDHAEKTSLMANNLLNIQGDAATEIERLTYLLKSKEDELLNVSEKAELWKLRCNSMSTLDMHRGAAIIQQVVFYFSDNNLQYDGYLVSCMRKHPEGFVPLEWVANFQRLQSFHATPIMLSGLLHNAIGIEFNVDQTAIRCSHGRWAKYVGNYVGNYGAFNSV